MTDFNKLIAVKISESLSAFMLAYAQEHSDQVQLSKEEIAKFVEEYVAELTGKKPRAPSDYNLFCKTHRDEVKARIEKNPNQKHNIAGKDAPVEMKKYSELTKFQQSRIVSMELNKMWAEHKEKNPPSPKSKSKSKPTSDAEKSEEKAKPAPKQAPKPTKRGAKAKATPPPSDVEEESIADE